MRHWRCIDVRKITLWCVITCLRLHIKIATVQSTHMYVQECRQYIFVVVYSCTIKNLRHAISHFFSSSFPSSSRLTFLLSISQAHSSTGLGFTVDVQEAFTVQMQIGKDMCTQNI